MEGENYHPANLVQSDQDYVNQDDYSKELDVHKDILGGFNPRLGFIRKVYAILSVQLLITIAIASLSIFWKSFADFQENQIWLFFVIIAASCGLMITLFCYQEASRKVPTNYLLLGGFTLCMAY